MWSISQHSVTAAQVIPHHLERKVLTRPVSVMHLCVLGVGKEGEKETCPVNAIHPSFILYFQHLCIDMRSAALQWRNNWQFKIIYIYKPSRWIISLVIVCCVFLHILWYHSYTYAISVISWANYDSLKLASSSQHAIMMHCSKCKRIT